MSIQVEVEPLRGWPFQAGRLDQIRPTLEQPTGQEGRFLHLSMHPPLLEREPVFGPFYPSFFNSLLLGGG